MKISQTVSEVWSGHEYIVEMVMFNIQRVLSPYSRQIRVMVHVFCTSCCIRPEHEKSLGSTCLCLKQPLISLPLNAFLAND